MRPHPPSAQAAGSSPRGHASVRLEPISPKPAQFAPAAPHPDPRDKSTVTRYFRRHGITDMLQMLTEKLIIHLPQNPARFMQQELGEKLTTDRRAEEATTRGVSYLRAQIHYEGPEGRQRATFSRPVGSHDTISRERAVSEAVETLRTTFWGHGKETCEPLSDRETEVEADEAGAVFAELVRTVGAEAISLAKEEAASAKKGTAIAEQKAAAAQEEAASAKHELMKTQTEVNRLKRQLMERGHISREDDDDGTRLPGQWVNVRVFISSSFIDTQAERDMIVQNVLPKLNHELAKNYVRVTFVDLRWGVASHESANCEAIQKTCLDEIERCVEVSPCLHPCPSYPFFVCLRTRRKGWVMDAINKPDAFEKPGRFRWIEDEDLGVRDKKLSITELELYHGLLGRSEDNHGHTRSFVYFREDGEFMKEVDDDMHWIFDFEHISAEDVEDQGLPDSVKIQYQITPEAALRRKDYHEVNRLIKQRANDSSGVALVRKYTPSSATTRITGQLDGGKMFGVGHVIGLQDLERQIFVDLFQAIDAQYPIPHRRIDSMALEDTFHTNHISSHKACFGRESLLQEMLHLLDFGVDVRCPVAVVGLPGSGKTTVMSEFIKRLLNKATRPKLTKQRAMTKQVTKQMQKVLSCSATSAGHDKELVVFFHIVASSPQSFSVKNMLTRLCEFLKKRCDLTLEVPKTMETLRNSWMHFVLMAAQKYKVVIVLDAINQLSNEHNALSLCWLPTSLPKDFSVRIICSMIENDHQADTDNSEDDQHEILKKRQQETAQTQLVVRPMQQADQEKLVEAFLRQFHKSLTPKQMKTMLEKEDAGSPLYLITACHKLIELGVYEEMDAEISKLPQRKIPLLADVIESLIAMFGKDIIRSTLLFVYFSQGGIFEHELLHLVSQEVTRLKAVERKEYNHGGVEKSVNASKLESFSFGLLYQRLKPLLPTTASGLLQFFHNDMRTLIFQLFLGGKGNDLSPHEDENQQKQFELQTEEEKSESLRFNRILAEYYLEQVEEQGNYELRTIQSVTAHMVKAKMMDDLRKVLLLPRVFKAMFSSDLRVEFLSLWAECLSSLASTAATSSHPLSEPSVQVQNETDARISKIFRDFDVNGDGGISLREFKPLALHLGYDKDTTVAEFEDMDMDGNGEIDQREFQASFGKMRQSMPMEDFDDLLKQLDKGRDLSAFIDKSRGSKNLAHWYRESLSSVANDIDDPVEEAQVYSLLGDFFLLKRDEAHGLVLDSAESESFYKHALVLDPKSTSALIGLSRLERGRHEFEKAMNYLRDAMGSLQNFYGYNNIEVARCQRDMAEVCLMQNDLQTAKQVMAKARKIVTETCGKQSLEYSDFMMSEGDILAIVALRISGSTNKNLWKRKLLRDSIATYREALEKQKQVMGDKHPIVLMSCDRLIANVMEQPDMLTEDFVAEFAKPRIQAELSISGTLQRASAFQWLEMLLQLHKRQQQENESEDIAPGSDTKSLITSSLWYKDIDAKSRKLRAVETQPVQMTEAVRQLARMMKPAHNMSLALQVRAGTDVLELGVADGSANQLWLWHGEEVQNLATGLFLDADVKYSYTGEPSNPWETNGIPLYVRPRSNCDRQRWMVDGLWTRHKMGGLIIGLRDPTCNRWMRLTDHSDVEFSEPGEWNDDWSLERFEVHSVGTGLVGLKNPSTCRWVRVTSAWERHPAHSRECFELHEIADGCVALYNPETEKWVSWTDDGKVTTVARSDSDWSNRCFQVKVIGSFEENLIEGSLIRHVIGGQALDVNFWLLEKGVGVNLNLPSNEGKQSLAWVVQDLDGKENVPNAPVNHCANREARMPITHIPDGAEFYIKCAANTKRCLSVRSDGYTKDPAEIYLTAVDPSVRKQKWRLVDGDTIQNVESGQFLHTATKYVCLEDRTELWNGSETILKTSPQDFSDAQRWHLGPETFQGGQLLRHYKDGRSLCIVCWQIENGENVACMETAMGSCKGNAWIFDGDNFTTSSKRPGRKLKLALRDGRGLALEHEATTMGDYKYAQVLDLLNCPKSYEIRMTSAAKASEIEFTSNGEAVLTAGDHQDHLGLKLTTFDTRFPVNHDFFRSLGNPLRFTDFPTYQWQLNEDDGTISPRGARHVVLGWRGHLQLVKRGSAAQLQFVTAKHQKLSYLSEHFNALVDTPNVKTSSRSNFASRETIAAMTVSQLTTINAVVLKLVAEKVLEISPEMLRVLITPETAQAAQQLLELGAEITNEVRNGLLNESDHFIRLYSERADTEGLVRWYSFDKLVQGEGETLRVGNCAHLVNPEVLSQDDQSLISSEDFGEPPKLTEKWGRVVAEFAGKHGLGSKVMNGCPEHNDAYTVELWMDRPEPGQHEWTAPYSMGPSDFKYWDTGLSKSTVKEGVHNLVDEKSLVIGVNPASCGVKHAWTYVMLGGCVREHIDSKTWKGAEDGEDESWLRVAATWDPISRSRKIFVNGKMVKEDDAQETGKEHDLPGADEGGILVVGSGGANCIEDTEAFTGCIAEVRVWKRALEPSALFRELAVPCKTMLEALVLDTSKPCQELVKTLCNHDQAIRAAVQSPTTLMAALKTKKTADAALHLLQVHDVKITDEVRDALLAKDPVTSRLEKLLQDDKCLGLINALSTRDATIKAVVNQYAQR